MRHQMENAADTLNEPDGCPDDTVKIRVRKIYNGPGLHEAKKELALI